MNLEPLGATGPLITGGGASGVLLLSECPKEQAHFMLQRLIKRAGYDKDHFYFASLSQDVLTEATRLGVKVIVPLGERALRATIGEVDIMRWRGRVVSYPGTSYFVLPTYKVSRLLHRKQPKDRKLRDPEIMRNPPRYQRNWLRDLMFAVHVSKHGFERMPVEYLLDPSPEVFLKWAQTFLMAYSRNRELLLSFDIETPYKQKVKDEDELEESEAEADLNTSILRISFSYEEGKAVTIPWLPQYYPAIRLLLESRAGKVVWNGLYFDVPVLEGQGFATNGTIFDGMDAFHFLKPQLDKGLEAVSADATDVLPWKHLSDAQPQWYSAVDSDVALRNFNWTAQRLREQGAWDNYVALAVRAMVHLKRAGRAGNLVDNQKQSEFRDRLDVEIERLEREIQRVVPEALKPTKRYKSTPDIEVLTYDEIRGRVHSRDGRVFQRVTVQGKRKVCSVCGQVVSNKSEHLKGGKKKNACAAGGACLIPEIGAVEEWDEILPFNANSSDQLKMYMKAHGHPVGKDNKDADKETADAKHLKFLAGTVGKDFPLYQLAYDRHKVAKARTTYVPTPDELGMVYTTFTNTPWTWRLGSRALNFQNWGKSENNPWAKEARMQIIARPGTRFVGADSSAVEAVIQGWQMGDEEFMRIAAQSIYSWLVAKRLGWEFTPESVERIKAEHQKLYRPAKVTYLMTGYGGTPYMLWKLYPELFPRKKDAEAEQRMLFDLVPGLEALQWNLRLQAHKQTFLMSPWNVRFDFFDVFTYKRDKRTGEILYAQDGRPMIKLGKDGNNVVAVIPQHSNGMFNRENTNLIGDSEWGGMMRPNYTQHDSYILEVPVGREGAAMEFLDTVLTRPIPQLGNLRVGAEFEIGSNWAEASEKNPEGMRTAHKHVIEKQDFSYLPPKPVVGEIGSAA